VQAQQLATGYFTLTGQGPQDRADLLQFQAEFIRMKIFQCLHTLETDFQTVDTDADGLISQEELFVLLESTLGNRCARQCALDLLHEIDTDDDGFISVAEFRQWYDHRESNLRQQILKKTAAPASASVQAPVSARPQRVKSARSKPVPALASDLHKSARQTRRQPNPDEGDELDTLTLKQASRQVANCCAILADVKSHGWEDRQDALDTLRRTLKDPSHPKTFFDKQFISTYNVKIAQVITTQLEGLRSEITGTASDAMIAASEVFGRRFGRGVLNVLPDLLRLMGGSNRLIRTHVNDGLAAVIQNVRHKGVLLKLMQTIETGKSKVTQQSALEHFKALLSTWPKKLLRSQATGIRHAIGVALKARAPEARALARECQAVFDQTRK
jgi:hypothetical protein